MIAYQHYVDFIPKLANEKSVAGSFSNIITVKKSHPFDLYTQLPHQKKYYNNQGRDITLFSNSEFARTQKGQLWGYEIEDVVSFFWESGTKTLRYLPHEKFTEQLLEYWTLHIVLPIFFIIEETYNLLHAGAVEVDGKPILFVAESFGGKSTMTDFFIKQGHTMISDDKVACHEEKDLFFALPSYPYHRPYRKLEDLGYFVENVAAIPKPIHAIYELEQSDADAIITIKELHGIEKFKALRYSSEFNLTFLKTKQFTFLTRLAKVVPVYKVTVPWDMKCLPEVHKVICEHSINIGNMNKS